MSGDGIKNFIKQNYLAVIVLLVAFLVRFLYIYSFKDTLFFEGLSVDERSFQDLAMRLSGGERTLEPFAVAPLYPYLLALFYKVISADLFILKFVQIIVGSFSSLLVYQLAKRLLDSDKLGFACGVGFALYAPLIFFDATSTGAFLSVFSLLLSTLFLLRIETGGLRAIFLGAIFLAMTALVRESALLLVPVVALWIIRKKAVPARVKKLLIFIFGIIIIILPVTLLNFAASGEVVLVSTAGGKRFYQGTIQEAGGSRPLPGALTEKAREIGLKGPSARGASALWYKEGLREILADPGAALSLNARKFLLFWNYYEDTDGGIYSFIHEKSRVLKFALFGFGILAPFAMLGFFLTLRRRAEFALVQLIILVSCVGALLEYNHASLRLPLIGFFMILALYSLRWFVYKALERKVVYIAIGLYVLVIFFITVNYDMRSDAQASVTDPSSVSADIRQGRPAGR